MLTSRRATSLCLFATLFVVAADDPEKKDSEKIVGNWAMAAFEQDGNKIDEARLKDQRMIFQKEKYLVKLGDDTVEEGTYTLDSSKTPKTIDLKITKGNDEGRSQPGIFKFDGEKFIGCFAHPGDKTRPTEFTSKADPATILVTLKPVKG